MPLEPLEDDLPRAATITLAILRLVCMLLLATSAIPCAAEPFRVLAAVTLKPALDAVATKYGRGEVLLVCGPSPTLAKQVEDGVPADLFLSADELWMDELAKHNLLKLETVADLVSNHLVLIAQKGRSRQVAMGAEHR